MCTQKEAAAILQVHVDTLQKFFRAHSEAREAWGAGKEIGRAQLRMPLWQQALEDPAQDRFLAKQKAWLGCSDKASIDKVEVTVEGRSEAERRTRIIELQEKLLKTTAVVDNEMD